MGYAERPRTSRGPLEILKVAKQPGSISFKGDLPNPAAFPTDAPRGAVICQMPGNWLT